MMPLTGSRVRLAEIVASLSLIIDLGLGQPLEHALRSTIIAVRLGDVIGLSAADLSDTYFLTMLRFVGCTAAAHEMAEVLGDEVAARSWLTPVFTGRPEEMIEAVQANVAVGQSESRRAGRIAETLEGLVRLHGTGAAQCEVAQLLSDRLGLPSSTRESLGAVFERWDGLGVPHGMKGEEIPLSVQVAQLAQNAEMYWRRGGIETAVAVIRNRANSAHDPRLVERFCASSRLILSDLDHGSIWSLALESEPGRPRFLNGAEIDQAATAFADFADLKSSFTLGHSRGVSDLAAAAARQCGLAEEAITLLRRAALVQDVGRAGITASIWDKPGPLTTGEWERVRLHPYYSERALVQSVALAGIGRLAGQHHERLDGTGYHRGLAASQVSVGARILGAADAFRAMREPRSYRAALSVDQTARELQREVQAGRLDGDVVSAVLSAAGQHRRPG